MTRDSNQVCTDGTTTVRSRPSRRAMLGGAGALGFAAPFGLFHAANALTGLGANKATLEGQLDQFPICRVAANGPINDGPARALKLAWNATAICTSAAPVAKERGIFARHGLEVEFVNFGGSTEQLLEAIATGKADAGIGMALRWLKPSSKDSTCASRPEFTAAACACWDRKRRASTVSKRSKARPSRSAIRRANQEFLFHSVAQALH